MPSNKRLFELDALRAVAIVLIVFSHLISFIKSNLFILTVNSINYIFPVWFYGLSLFFFISGFVLHYKHPTISSRQDAIDFLKRRVVRIYPLYWIALAVFITLGITLGMDAWNFFLATIYICGLQVFFPPGGEGFGLLWFVGVILLYYLIYLVLARLSHAPKLLLTAVLGFPLFFVVLRLAFNIVDSRFFVYYGIFIAGVIASKYNLLYRTNAKRRYAAYSIALFCGVISIVALVTKLTQHLTSNIYQPTASLSDAYSMLNDPRAPLSYANFIVIVLANVLALLFIYWSFNSMRLILPSVSVTTRKLVAAIAFASYSIYLFHLPFLWLLSTNLYAAHVAWVPVILLGSVPVVFLLCYAIQLGENMLIRKYMGRRQQNAER